MSATEFWGGVLAAVSFVCGWIVVGVLLLVFGVSELRHDLTSVDVTRLCSTTSDPCLSRRPARIEQAEAGLVTVSYDDGRSTGEVEVVDAMPAPRTRLLLEHWGDELVSLYDPSTGRRYRTDRWPEPWGLEGVLSTAGGALMLAPCLAFLGAFAVLRARRAVRRSAA